MTELANTVRKYKGVTVRRLERTTVSLHAWSRLLGQPTGLVSLIIHEQGEKCWKVAAAAVCSPSLDRILTVRELRCAGERRCAMAMIRDSVR